MIRNATNLASKATRNCSTSQESNKVKKSSSTSSKNSNNISTLGNSMSSSIKTRVETSSSNKKSILNTSTSNKSLKTLRENANGAKGLNTSSNFIGSKKKEDKENKEIKEEKKGAIMVKNIKNKIVGGAVIGKQEK